MVVCRKWNSSLVVTAKNKNLNNYKGSQRCIIYFYEIMNKKLFFITVNNIQDIVLPDSRVQSAIASCYLIILIRLELCLPLIELSMIVYILSCV
jgi:hypothetical protein